MLKKYAFLNTNCLWFVTVLTSENNPKSSRFSIVRFCENRGFVEARARYSRFGISKNRTKNALEKRHTENHKKVDLGVILGPKIDPTITSKSFQKKGVYPPTNPSLAPLRPTPQGKPKRTPTSHPFI